MNLKITRPVEELVGSNRGIVRQKLGRIHCCTPLFEAVRKVRPRGMRKAPPELRRGLILCVANTLDEYRATYFAVQYRREYAPEKFTR